MRGGGAPEGIAGALSRLLRWKPVGPVMAAVVAGAPVMSRATPPPAEVIRLGALAGLGKGPALPGFVQVWAGQRWAGPGDMMLGEQAYTSTAGSGTGVVLKRDAAALDLGLLHNQNREKPASRLQFDLTGIGTPGGGRVRLLATATRPHAPGGHEGFALTGQHAQAVGSASHIVLLQYAQGSTGLDGNFGDFSQPADRERWRIVDGFTWPGTRVGAQAFGAWQLEKAPGGARTSQATAGLRLSLLAFERTRLVSDTYLARTHAAGNTPRWSGSVAAACMLNAGPSFFDPYRLKIDAKADVDDMASPGAVRLRYGAQLQSSF